MAVERGGEEIVGMNIGRFGGVAGDFSSARTGGDDEGIICGVFAGFGGLRRWWKGLLGSSLNEDACKRVSVWGNGTEGREMEGYIIISRESRVRARK